MNGINLIMWTACMSETPAQVARLLLQAADYITGQGYDPHGSYGNYSGSEGTNITDAVKYAITAHAAAAGITVDGHADIEELTEQIETRLAGIMYATGAAARRTSILDISDTVAHWELGRADMHTATAEEAVGLLKTAATMLAALGA
jgi:hypothetical protein